MKRSIDEVNEVVGSEYPYELDAADHCETPVEAYLHISGVLETLARSLGKTRATLSIYDPYYCEGGMVERLRSLGFGAVYNKCEDFYDRIANETTPSFDVLVTNPPYSGEHVSRLFDFCRASGKPWFVLVPNYCYTKPYYVRFLQDSKAEYFYIAPKKRYLYLTPKGRRQHKSSKITSPFITFWYCHVPSSFCERGGLREIVQRCVDRAQVDVAHGTPSAGLPPTQLDERDDKKKKERNNLKRKKNKERQKKLKG